MGERIEKAERWVAVRVTAPRWLTLQVPRVIARRLELRVDRLRPGRRIAFLNWGPGVTQVIPVPEEVAGPGAITAHEPTLAIATFTGDLLFKLPGAVQNHLGLRIARRGTGRAKGTDDLLAWMVPEREWAEENSAAAPSAAHVYLTRSLFPAMVPS